MRILFLTVIFLLTGGAFAQTTSFSIHHIKLPAAVSYYDNQFSGLQIAGKKLYLLSECRVQDKREAVIYVARLSDIERSVEDSLHEPQFEKIMIYGLDTLAAIMAKQEQEYEGLEAFVIKNKTVYLSVETSTPSPLAYILKGRIKGNGVYLDKQYIPVPKPLKPDGSHIYNAGFEAMSLVNNKLHLFFEYNSFDKNFIYTYNTSFDNIADSIPFQPLPFRITDITPAGDGHFTAINLFYKGGGGDTIYRVPEQDTLNNRLIKTNGIYEDYSRLINIQHNTSGFTWEPVWEFPVEYRGYNWEGIAAYKNGYFVVNDKYTRNKPYVSTLLYLKRSLR